MSHSEDEISENVFTKYLRILKSKTKSKRTQVWIFVVWQIWWSYGHFFLVEFCKLRIFSRVCRPWSSALSWVISLRVFHTGIFFKTFWIYFVKCGVTSSKLRSLESNRLLFSWRGLMVKSDKIMGNFGNFTNRSPVDGNYDAINFDSFCSNMS